ncbi:MAG TPA: HIT family protein [Beutenbergiaceae bacterium]|nr:HIT family protein [Beutenbergiaceae bacterium]
MTVFTKIINGQIPGRFVWSDSECVAFLTAEPLQPGHTLVVSREEIDHWLDVPDDLAQHLFAVARHIGRAQREEFEPTRVGLLIEGYGVPHVHLHVWPSQSTADFDPTNVDRSPDPGAMDTAAQRLRSRLRSLGHGQFVPEP